MKRSWTMILSTAGLVTLLVILGALQYRWQTQIAENEGDRMRRRVQEDVSRFAADFNREIQNAYFNFQVESDRWQRHDYHPFVERYEYWRGKAKYPELIRSIYFIQEKPKFTPLVYDASARTFTEASVDEELSQLLSRVGTDKELHQIDAESYSLIMPIFEEPKDLDEVIVRRSPIPPNAELKHLAAMHRPETFGYLAIRLDPAVIKEKILPDLALQYFPDGEFNVTIADKNGNDVLRTKDISGEPDVQTNMFAVNPADFIYFANKKLLAPREDENRNGGVIVNEHFESRTSRVESSNGRTVKVEVAQGGKPRTTVFSKTAEPEGEWLLTAQHRDGSITANLENTKRRNLGIAFGILGLVGAAVGLTIFSAHRAKVFAQRQVDFVSSVSHEFRTPLAVICSAGENLADGIAVEKKQVNDYGNLIKGEGRKLSDMVEQILEFAGAKSRKPTFHFAAESVDAVVNDAVNECEPLLRSQGFYIETEIAEGLPQISADKAALSRALQNLIANSVKYSNGSRWVRVRAVNGGSNVRISVEDRGIGISASDLRHIFEPFYRSKDVVDAQIHGNGLGLSLVKQVAEAHGGKVKAESALGTGSLFTIELPI